MIKHSAPLLLAGLLTSLSLPALAAPKVTATIAPVHSLVASIMQNVGEPSLLFPTNTSPHDAQMRPSQARQLQEADVIFWVGPDIETAVERALDSLGDKAKSVALINAHGIKRLPVREDANWERHSHDHGEHDHDAKKHDDHDHDEHAHDKSHDEHAHEEHDHDKHDHDAKKHDDHDHDEHAHDKNHDEHAHKEHDHDKHDHDAKKHDDHDHDEHAHGEHWDSHIWLAPKNAIAMAKAISHELAEIDPENAKVYEKNSKNLIASIEAQITKIDTQLSALKDQPFMVFHDAYQYYEQQFGLNAVGSIRLHPEVAPGAARIKQIREKLVASEVVCLMSEPQFSDAILPPLIEGTKTRLGLLDPIGKSLEVGPSHYLNLLQFNADNLEKCLTGNKS